MSAPTDTNVNQRWEIKTITRPDGVLVCEVPKELWFLLLRKSGVKSKKKRIRKKVVQRVFNSLLAEMVR